jgi:hypothetical protein
MRQILRARIPALSEVQEMRVGRMNARIPWFILFPAAFLILFNVPTGTLGT